MKKKLIAVVIIFFFFNATLYVFGYHVPRSSFYTSLALYTFLFGGYIFIYKLFDNQSISLKRVLVISLITRLVLMGATPQLSDDYTRFIWDGHLTINQIDPYQYTPTAVLDIVPPEKRPFFASLYGNLNSPEYYSIYPVTNQVVFALGAFIGQDHVVWNVYVIRLILIVFECLVIYNLFLLINYLQIPPKRILLYALNPLVLIEITGNLHFEGMMLCFLVVALVLTIKKQVLKAGAYFGLSIAVKLTPLVLVPAFFNYLKKRSFVNFGFTAALMAGGSFMPILFLESTANFLQSVRLYHGIFEFNASIYYALRSLGILIFQNNPIRILSPILSLLTIFFIVRHFWKSESRTIQALLEGIVFSYLIFYLLNTVVHPWYLITAVGVSILTQRRYFLVWSYLVFLSYFTYRSPTYEESTLMLFIEYFGLFVAVMYDYRKNGKLVPLTPDKPKTPNVF